MKRQKTIFLEEEGDRWFKRNKYTKPKNDLADLTTLLQQLQLSPQKILEIGCANGNNLVKLHQAFNAECYGLDPSQEAIYDGRTFHPQLNLHVGTADELPFEKNCFDAIIFGFCLYLCDREDLFAIAYHADRCLKDEGIIIIKDFAPPFPYRNDYQHYQDVYSYKMDYSRLFSWSPSYQVLANVVYSHHGFKDRTIPDEKVATVILQKNSKYAYPLSPVY